MRSFTWNEVCTLRLRRNYLAKPADKNAIPKVTSAVGGVQAQILSAAELALGARVSGVNQKEVEDELWKSRRIVKTIGPRQTLHLLPADELSMWMAAMRARNAFYEVHWYEKDGLTSAQAEALLDAIGETLDGRCLTRQQLAEETSRRAGSWTKEKLESPWGNLLGPAAFSGLLCFGPNQGIRATFVRADQWVADYWKEVDPGEALKEACRRYLAAYGPAGYQGFGHWFGLKPADARQVMQTIGDELEEVSVAGRQAWRMASEEDSWTVEERSLRLLPQYDCYILGCGEREWVVPEVARKRVSRYGRGRFEGATGLPVLLVDRIVAGMWERQTHGKHIDLRVEPFIELKSDQHQQLRAEARRVGEFFDKEVSLSVGTLE